MGNLIQIDAAQYSDARGDNGYGAGGGPAGVQRMLLGYTGRKDYVDINGHAWRPATEIVVRTGRVSDPVSKTWWTMKQGVHPRALVDSELYDYGMHARDFTVNVTVGPGTYYVRLKFADSQHTQPNRRAINIYLNDEKLLDRFDIAATGATLPKLADYNSVSIEPLYTPVDLVFSAIQPKNGVIEIRLTGETVGGIPSEAILQALEVGQGDAGKGAVPVSATLR
jgi:hypothetical protein